MLSWIHRNALVDIGYTGSEYTWRKRTTSTTTLRERLGWGVSTIKWRLAFPDAVIRHLPRSHSNHCPLLITVLTPRSLAEPTDHFDSIPCGLYMRILGIWCIIFGSIISSPWIKNWQRSRHISLIGTKRYLEIYSSKNDVFSTDWKGLIALLLRRTKGTIPFYVLWKLICWGTITWLKRKAFLEAEIQKWLTSARR